MKKDKVFIRCICCGSEIESLEEITQDNLIKEMWGGGIVGQISANYGSDYDGDIYTVAICDGCIKEKQDKGLIKFQENLFGC